MLTAPLQKGETHSSNEYPVYDTRLHLMVRLKCKNFEENGVPIIAIIPRFTQNTIDSTF